MARKKSRRASTPRGHTPAQVAAAGSRKRRRRSNTPSLIFIGLILLMFAIVAAVTLLDGDTPECPPGLVWSDAHAHCH